MCLGDEPRGYHLGRRRNCRIQMRTAKIETVFEEQSFSWCPPLPLARELKVVRCDQGESHGCELRRSPGLAVAPALSNQDRCGAFPRRRPAMERLAAVACAYTESALQSRGGNGFHSGDPDQAEITNPSSRARSSR